jgi:hypothetical protein
LKKQLLLHVSIVVICEGQVFRESRARECQGSKQVIFFAHDCASYYVDPKQYMSYLAVAVVPLISLSLFRSLANIQKSCYNSFPPIILNFLIITFPSNCTNDKCVSFLIQIYGFGVLTDF